MDKLKGRIVFLDYMRLFAFSSVLIGHKLFHYLQAYAADPTNHVTLRVIAEALIPLCNGGAAGVLVFFLTSGYIITHVLQSESANEFLIKRIFRIYPLYIFAVTLEIVLANLTQGTPPPTLLIYIKQALLIGDFFNTPYALAGVEWTLRIEILFYLYMFALKSLKAFSHQTILPIVHFGTACALYVMPAFPKEGMWTIGYLNAYAPFLLVGSFIYLLQQQLVSKSQAILACTFMLYASLQSIAVYHPTWSTSNYAVFALGIFTIAWHYRNHLYQNRVINTLSNLTYSVYLFHNWLWEYLAHSVRGLGLVGIANDIATLSALLICSYAAYRTVETYGVKLGRLAVKLTNKLLASSRNRFNVNRAAS